MRTNNGEQRLTSYGAAAGSTPATYQVLGGCCCRRRHPPPAIPMNHQDDMVEMFDNLPGLTTLQRESAKARFRFLLNEYRWRSWQYAILFYLLRITMTVGSLTVPALLSLKVSDPIGEAALYWTTWAISLAVTTSNGLMTLFKLDKRFFMLHGVAERLRTETWQFLTLAGRYSGHYGGDEAPSHANQFVHYCTNIEKIRMRHMDDEYISVGEGDSKKSVQAAATPHTGTTPAGVNTTTQALPLPAGGGAPPLPPTGTFVPLPTKRSSAAAYVPSPPNLPLSRHPSFVATKPLSQSPTQIENVISQDTKEPSLSLSGQSGTAV